MDNITPSKMSLDTPLVYFEIKNNILHATYKQGISIDLDGAKEIVKNRLVLQKNTPYRIMVIDAGMKSVSKEARDYLSKEGAACVIAGALVMKSVYSTFIGNFFLKLTKPPFPTKLFTEEKKALEWLEQFESQSFKNRSISNTIVNP